MRTVVAGAVRSRVVGADPAGRAAAIFEAPGPRWFTPDDPIWVVHADPAMFVGGLRALLLQSLHPLAMAGVAAHSDYRNDPWGRLQRTADFLARTTYGTVEQAEAASARVRAVHGHVHGVAPDGRPYSARDPHLLRWVHLAEVDSFLAAHRRFGARRLTPFQADRYVEQTGRAAAALGVVDPPGDLASLKEQLAAYRPELVGTRAAREAAAFLMVPPMPVVARAPYAVLVAAAVAMVPPWARRQLWLPFLPVTERLAVQPAGRAMVGLLRWALTPAPRSA